MAKRKQLPNSAANWVIQHKDALLPTNEELDDLPYCDTTDNDDYAIKVYREDTE